ncbi:autotransporter outer membrane beta-barrel domain-containing protein [Alienimonas californiensis]|uniref:Autotransporter beta-domain protein n=1 Tax=Alienimonas californiensis TaxID=2527989 RepID=A0A517PBD4_9PLAN|nr:autotransporter outer membrane beta-barrel domain-containing protein [Alienimonas californiensis]QDT16693.1 Autotransporter beta-domain protein [Alienimonas californiensis]
MDVPPRIRRTVGSLAGGAWALGICLAAPSAAPAQDETVVNGQTRIVSATETRDDFVIDPGGTAAIAGTGFLTVEDLLAQGLTTVADGGRLDAATFNLINTGQLQSAGDVNVVGDAIVGGAGSGLNATGGTFDASSLYLNAAAVSAVGADAVVTVTSLTRLNAAALTVAGAVRAGADVEFLTASAGVVQDGGTLTSGGRIRLAGGSTLTIDAGGRAVTGGALELGGGGLLVNGVAEVGAGLDYANATVTVGDGGLLSSSGAVEGAGGAIDLQSGGTFRLNGTWTTDRFELTQGARLTGNATLNTANGVLVEGTLAPGTSPGTMTVNGPFATGSTAVLDIELNPVAASVVPQPGVDFDQIAVNGDAVIDGGTLRASQFASGSLVRGTRYDFLVADRLTVLDPLTLQNQTSLRLISVYDATTYSLIVGRDGPYAGLGVGFNQRAVGGALDAAVTNPALAGLLDALDTLPSDAATAASLNALSGEIYGTHLTALNRSSLQFLDAVGGRDVGFPLVCGTCGVTRPGQSGLQGWIESYGAGGHVDGDGNAAPADLGTAGVAVGLSRIFGGPGGCVEVGAFYGYESMTVRVPEVDSTVTDEIHRVGGSVRASAGRTYARLSGFAGASAGEALRSFQVDSPLFPLSDRTRGEFDGTLAAGDAEAGLLHGSSSAYLMPVAGLRYVRVDRDAFAESGGVSALAVEESSLDELRARVGLRAGRRLALWSNLPANGTFEAFYSRDLTAGTVGDFRANLVADPTAAFTARGTDFDADRFVLGPGLTLGDGPVRLSGQYRAGFGDAAVLHAGDVRLEVCF